MKTFPPVENTLADAGRRIRNGDSTCVEILTECLERIDANEADIHAWVAVGREQAMKQAKALDQELASGKPRGPLHGIPVGIKDIVDVAGFVTGAGSDWWSSQPPREQDAPLVTALREAGVVIIGKTVTTQFAGFDPSPTRNPWNLDRTPAGSSSGSGAAIAAGHCLGAIGSQTGGSITRPSAFCGIAGCKPTLNRISMKGVVPIARHLDHPGPMARTVGDLSIMMSVLVPDLEPGVSLSEPPTFGRVRNFSEDRLDPAMRQAMEVTLDTLMAAEAQVYDLGQEFDFAELLVHHKRIMAVEGAAFHREAFKSRRDDYLPCIASLIEEGLAASAVDYVASRKHQMEVSKQLDDAAGQFDALVTPAATGPAPDLTTTGDPCMNAPWSYSGLPTVCFPIGLSDDGMPLSIQLTGQRNAESKLLAVARWCEDAVRKSQSQTG